MLEKGVYKNKIEVGSTLNECICATSHARCPKLKKCDNGVCSLNVGGAWHIICPRRFDMDGIFLHISKTVLGTRDYSVLDELKVGNNFFDYVIVSNSEPDKFIPVELQSLDTCGSYKRIAGDHSAKPFCINWKATEKTILSQMITKVGIAKESNKKLALVLQDHLLKRMENDYSLVVTDFCESDDLYLYECCFDGRKVRLNKAFSISYEKLKNVFESSRNFDLNECVRNRFLLNKE